METLKAIQTRNSVAHLTEPAPSSEEMEEVYQYSKLIQIYLVRVGIRPDVIEFSW